MNITSYSSGAAAYNKSTQSSRVPSQGQGAPAKLETEPDGDQDDSAILQAAIATENSKAASSLIGRHLNELA
jgi:hypothetical protein